MALAKIVGRSITKSRFRGVTAEVGKVFFTVFHCIIFMFWHSNYILYPIIWHNDIVVGHLFFAESMQNVMVTGLLIALSNIVL